MTCVTENQIKHTIAFRLFHLMFIQIIQRACQQFLLDLLLFFLLAESSSNEKCTTMESFESDILGIIVTL